MLTVQMLKNRGQIPRTDLPDNTPGTGWEETGECAQKLNKLTWHFSGKQESLPPTGGSEDQRKCGPLMVTHTVVPAAHTHTHRHTHTLYMHAQKIFVNFTMDT